MGKVSLLFFFVGFFLASGCLLSFYVVFPLPPCFFFLLFFLPSIVECQPDNIISNSVVPDGYGLSYSIGDDYIRWTITSLKRDTKVLKHYLAEAASDVKAMLEAAEKAETKAVGMREAKL